MEIINKFKELFRDKKVLIITPKTSYLIKISPLRKIDITTKGIELKGQRLNAVIIDDVQKLEQEQMRILNEHRRES